MKRSLLAAMMLLVTANLAYAGKTTYIATNHRFNSVRLSEVKGSVAEARMMTHPKVLDLNGLKAALRSIKLSRTFIIKKEIDSQEVFSDPDIDFLAPNMAEAFSKASPNEEVQFSYLSKNPLIILRNDRLTIGNAWIHDNELHIKFTKLYAKVSMDVDKRGNEAKAAAKARGLRIQLEIQPGQKLGIDDPEEIILDLNYNYVKAPEDKTPKEGVTMSGEKVPLETGAVVPATPEESAKPEKAVKGKASKTKSEPAAEVAPTAPVQKGVKDRLEELEGLKKQGLIDGKEYKAKKAEILKDL